MSVSLCLVHATLRSIRSCLKFSYYSGLWESLRTINIPYYAGHFLRLTPGKRVTSALWPQFPKSICGTIIPHPALAQGPAGHKNPSQRLTSPHYFSCYLDFHSRIAFPCLPVFILFFFSLYILYALSPLKSQAFETPNLKLLNLRSFSFFLELPSLPGVSKVFLDF